MAIFSFFSPTGSLLLSLTLSGSRLRRRCVEAGKVTLRSWAPIKRCTIWIDAWQSNTDPHRCTAERGDGWSDCNPCLASLKYNPLPDSRSDLTGAPPPSSASPDSGAATLGAGHPVQGHVQVSRQSAVICCVVPLCLSVPLVCVAPLL